MNEQIPTPPISDRRGSKVSLSLDPLKRIGSPGMFVFQEKKKSMNVIKK